MSISVVGCCPFAFANNGRSFALIGFCKRLVCANLRKGCVSWCVSLWAGSVCFCSFLRREGKNNCFDLQ